MQGMPDGAIQSPSLAHQLASAAEGGLPPGFFPGSHLRPSPSQMGAHGAMMHSLSGPGGQPSSMQQQQHPGQPGPTQLQQQQQAQQQTNGPLNPNSPHPAMAMMMQTGKHQFTHLKTHNYFCLVAIHQQGAQEKIDKNIISLTKFLRQIIVLLAKFIGKLFCQNRRNMWELLEIVFRLQSVSTVFACNSGFLTGTSPRGYAPSTRSSPAARMAHPGQQQVEFSGVPPGAMMIDGSQAMMMSRMPMNRGIPSSPMPPGAYHPGVLQRMQNPNGSPSSTGGVLMWD